MRLLSYDLPGQNKISARFLSFTECPIRINQPPVVNAGPDLPILSSQPAALNGTATDDGLPAGGRLSVIRSKVSGPSNVNFSNPNSAATTATFGAAGEYVLRLTANDSLLPTADEVAVRVADANRPPVVDAGLDQTASLPNRPAEQNQPFALHAISTGFNSPIGIDYHQPTGKVVMSVNYNFGGQPYNLERRGRRLRRGRGQRHTRRHAARGGRLRPEPHPVHDGRVPRPPDFRLGQ